MKSMQFWWHRCWWRILKTTGVGDNFEMLVTVLTILVTNISYFWTWASGTKIQKLLLSSKFCHQHQKIVANYKSPTSRCHQHLFHPSFSQPIGPFCRDLKWLFDLRYFNFTFFRKIFNNISLRRLSLFNLLFSLPLSWLVCIYIK